MAATLLAFRRIAMVTLHGFNTWLNLWNYPGGRMAVVLPHGALFRKGKEGEIRKQLLKMDNVEAVIGLGLNIFYGASLAACIFGVPGYEKERQEGQGSFY